MKRFAIVILLLALALGVGLPGMVDAAYIETFASNPGTWNYGYGTDFSSPLNGATYISTGGNPNSNGYITGPAVAGNGNGLYAVWTYATGSYGDMTGLTLTVDTRVTDGVTGTAQLYVGSNGTYYVDSTWAIGNDTSWTTHSSALNAANFTAWTGGPNGNLTLAQVLASPTDIGIFFGGMLAGGGGDVQLTNFGTTDTMGSPVPIPAAMYLFGPGMVGLVGLRRRFGK